MYRFSFGFGGDILNVRKLSDKPNPEPKLHKVQTGIYPEYRYHSVCPLVGIGNASGWGGGGVPIRTTGEKDYYYLYSVLVVIHLGKKAKTNPHLGNIKYLVVEFRYSFGIKD